MRVRSVVPPERMFVVTSSSIESRVRSGLRGLPGINVVGEPRSRNTAPALALASLLISLRSPEAVCAVLPSDHVVGNRSEFLRNLRQAAGAAGRGNLVVFGVRPTRAETGYGYVHAGGRERASGSGVLRVKRFVEKPDRRTAERFLRSGEYYWNSGMFVWRVDVFLDGVRRHMPALHRNLVRFGQDLDRRTLRGALGAFYSRADAESIDYGLLEKSRNIVMVKAGFSWDDLGAWTSLERISGGDKNGNVSHGKTVALDTKDCVIFSQQGLVATLGVRDLVIVRTEDVTLVCAREMAQEVKRVSRALSASGRLKKFL
jgi:mannose-1-phosphate guanylyltransferase